MASTSTLPRVTRRRRLSSEESVSSNSVDAPARRYEPGLSRTSTRPSAPVRTESPSFRSSLTVTPCQSRPPARRDLTSPATKLTPPALAEMRRSSRVCARAETAAHRDTETSASAQSVELFKKFFMWVLPFVNRAPMGRDFSDACGASILPHGGDFKALQTEPRAVVSGSAAGLTTETRRHG